MTEYKLRTCNAAEILLDALSVIYNDDTISDAERAELILILCRNDPQTTTELKSFLSWFANMEIK